ncbi:hypothetical protein WN73_07035 [Bradyrhizobium sp. CCBAU 45394]|nr:hypothetical protein [Bradyrhizobium sp. CCBAU 45394]
MIIDCSRSFADYYRFSAVRFHSAGNNTQTLPALDGVNRDVMSTSTLQPIRIPDELLTSRLMRSLDRLLRLLSLERTTYGDHA